MTTTTIKVPSELRDRITSQAHDRGESVAAFLSAVLEDWDRKQRMLSVKQGFTDGLDAQYLDETAAWDAISTGVLGG